MATRSGQKGEYWWLVAHELPDLRGALVQHHLGDRLCVTSFDSAPFRPGLPAERSGWTTRGDLAVSPSITAAFEVPSAGYDEWYLFEQLPDELVFLEVFANYLGFTLAPPSTEPRTSGDASAVEWLLDAQQRFWFQVERLKPISFVMQGHLDIVVSRRQEFVVDLCRNSGV